jgi:hypothetical protein
MVCFLNLVPTLGPNSFSPPQTRVTDGAIHRCFVPSVLALVVLLSFPTKSAATDLKEKTLTAWDGYMRSACLSTEARAKDSPFLRISELPERLLHVQAGEIPVWREGADQPKKVPHGLIHDWIGAVFIPKATIADVLLVTRDYEHYAEIYKPAVIEAKKVSSMGNDDRFFMLLVHKALFVTAAVKGEYETRYVQVDAKHWYSISQSTRLQAIENVGQPDMRVFPPDQGPGYVWRLFSLGKFEESDGGVYIELEALGLSRDVPILFRWLVQSIVEQLPRNSMRRTLEETRNAVLMKLGPPSDVSGGRLLHEEPKGGTGRSNP